MFASLSLDLDNQWSYMKTHGDSGWETYPTYFPLVVPRVLELLKRLDLKITFFIVGADCDRPENQEALRSIADAGHEIGNHSFHHEPWLHLYTRSQLDEEFERAERAIQKTTGVKPLGFRGPGFSYSDDVLQVLQERGYIYDASTFPTFLGPLARAYYFMHSRLSRTERDQRKVLFGHWSAGFGSNRPFVWKQFGTLREIPVTTLPWFKVPIHLSYVTYLATFSKVLAEGYFRGAMLWCKLNRVQPSYLLHPLDFLGCDDVSSLAFFPGMSLNGAAKMELAERFLGTMKSTFRCGTMLEHAERSP
ncbi:MAG: polysaccharide deacetylase [Planctomycetes bacterium]|nr:polysaccharide deacetylase [Planctomycetota bacterium]